MLATFVIGLREGLEAALIVGIIAAFLRKNGKTLVPMWAGVILAIALSIAVGFALHAVERSLPQVQQERMETVIGLVAVVFVTGMILWMNTHARDMKRQLESEAAHALGRASTYALASMAFLAVLKEGFETSVFLLATFSVAHSAVYAALGAVLGLLVAAAIGWGIYRGGVRINLSRFFRVTGAFLILVAAGLVMAALRTAHEAGWINAGQQLVVDLSGVIVPGSVQSALITGVLGIPSDPRLIEVLGWLVYLIPVALLVYWPARHRPSARMAIRLRAGFGAACLVAALALALGYPKPQLDLPSAAPLASSSSSINGSASLAVDTDGGMSLVVERENAKPVTVTLPTADARAVRHHGVDAQLWDVGVKSVPGAAPTSLTIEQVVALAGGRIPVGIDPRQQPGPFTAAWSDDRDLRVWAADGTLLDGESNVSTIVTLSGGGLKTPRTLRVRNRAGLLPPTAGWHVTDKYVKHAANAFHARIGARMERQLWAVDLPILLVLIGLWLLFTAWRGHRRVRQATQASPDHSSRSGQGAGTTQLEGVTHAAR